MVLGSQKMGKLMKLLLIIRRFNGDVLLTSPLINKLKERFPGSRIDILVNDNTRAVASFIDGIDNIICFDQSFREKRGINRFLSRLSLEIDLLKKIFRKYDLAINLTATDSSNLYAFLSAEKSIGVVEKGDFRKNWWKRLILSKTFEEDSDENILLHNTRPLSYLKIAKKDLHVSIKTGDKDLEESYDLIGKERPFVIIHPSSQFFYKTWPIEKTLRIAKKIKKTGLEVVIIRPPLVYGPNVKGNFCNMMKWLQKGIPLPLGAIHNQRSLIALANLIDLITTCIDHPAAAGQTFLVSDGEDLSTTKLLRRLGLGLGKPARLLPVPQIWLETSLNLIGKQAIAQRLCGNLQIDISRTREILNWSPPVRVDDALQQTAQAWLTQQNR